MIFPFFEYYFKSSKFLHFTFYIYHSTRDLSVRAAKGKARSLKNFIKTLRRPLDRAARFLYNGRIVNLG